jgi:hypothetical protein
MMTVKLAETMDAFCGGKRQKFFALQQESGIIVMS